MNIFDRTDIPEDVKKIIAVMAMQLKKPNHQRWLTREADQYGEAKNQNMGGKKPGYPEPMRTQYLRSLYDQA